MPASDGQREREGLVLDRRHEAGERLRRRSVEEGETRWCRKPVLCLLTLWEHECRHWLRLMALSRLDGGDRWSDEEDRLWARLRDRPSLLDRDRSPEGLLDLELPSARFDLDLCRAHGDALSPEGLSGCSPSGPIIHGGTAGPIEGWGGAAPKISSILSFMELRIASCMSCTQAWTFDNVCDDDGGTWEGVTVAWEDAAEGARAAPADTGVWCTRGPDGSPCGSGRRVGPVEGARERGRGTGWKNGPSAGGVGQGVFDSWSWRQLGWKRTRRVGYGSGKVVKTPVLVGGGTGATRGCWRQGRRSPDWATTVDPGEGHSYPVGFS